MLARIRKSVEEKDEGFTLIELLVVIIIIGILAAIAIPVFLSQRKKGYDAQAKSDARNLATLQESYFADNNKYQVSTDLASTKTALTDYKNSSNVTAVLMKDYSAAGVIGTAQDVGGYCIQVTSQSGNNYAYDSTKGGLQAGTATC
jgi:prepilin-type N-terminal cleavage/methylation domain-containing protein